MQDNTKAVTVTPDATGYASSFGPVDGPPGLQMSRLFDEVKALPDNGAGPSRFGEITFQNGAYRYTVTYGYALYDDAGQLREVLSQTLREALQVWRVWSELLSNLVSKRVSCGGFILV